MIRLDSIERSDCQRMVEGLITTFDGMPELREGMTETPKRYVKFLEEFLNPEPFAMTTFEKDCDEMVLVKDIPFYSLCEHHMAPFFGTAHIAYLPGDKIVGISKLPRVLDMFSRKFQNQERITKQVANYIND